MGAIRECRPVDTCTPGSNKLSNGQRLPDCNSSRARSLSPLRVHTPAPSPSPPLQPLQPAQHNSTGQMRPRFQTAPSNQMHLPDRELLPHRGPPALERWHTSAGSVRHRSVPCTAQQEAGVLRQGLGSALHQSNFARTTSTSSTDEALCSTGAAALVLEAMMVGRRPCTGTLEPQTELVAADLAPPAEGIPETCLQLADAPEQQESADGTCALILRSTSMPCHSSLSKSALPPPAWTQLPQRRRMKREGAEA